jgi:hypothetical protein
MAPAEFCRALLFALEASEGRRKRRKRDQTPDAIGLGLKRDLLRSAVEEEPSEQGFEGWLFAHAENSTALGVLEEWRLARAMPHFAAWLARGAPSDDAHDGGPVVAGSDPAAPRPDSGQWPHAGSTNAGYATQSAASADSAQSSRLVNETKPAVPSGKARQRR